MPTPSSTSAADPELDHVLAWFREQGDPQTKIGVAIRQALDEIIDTARTGRWDIEQCGRQEKAYVGVKIENVIRGSYELAYGSGVDYTVDGVNVDCKWSKSFNGWQIPNEAVGHICLVVWGDEPTNEMAVGLVRIRDEILVGSNRDQKRILQSPGGVGEVRWLVERGPGLPPNFLLHLPVKDREAILGQRGGDDRATELFRRCEGLIIYRHTVESIGQQIDAARRARATRPILASQGLELLNGHWKKDRRRAAELGGPAPANSEEWICLRSDGSTPERLAARRAIGVAP